MSPVTIFFIAVGLSFDTFAVSLTLGSLKPSFRVGKALGFALYFGFFQSLMLLVGFLAGLTIRQFVEHIAVWIAFGLLMFVGLKMIYESSLLQKTDSCSSTGFWVLTGLALATSIDALSVGISYSLLSENYIQPLMILGLVTVLASVSGIFIGNKLGILLGKRLEIAGGLVLIAMAIGILMF